MSRYEITYEARVYVMVECDSPDHAIKKGKQFLEDQLFPSEAQQVSWARRHKLKHISLEHVHVEDDLLDMRETEEDEAPSVRNR